MTLEQKWLARIDKQNDGCWLWLGGHWPRGYGKFYVGDGKRKSAHVWGYEHFVGPVSTGFELDHVCRNTGCVNYDHLEEVTHGENVRRGMSATVNGKRQRSLTHCAAGHKFSKANTRYWNGRRLCRLCDARRQRERRQSRDHRKTKL